MKLVPSRRSDYGLRAALFMARHPGQPAKAEAIADAMDIPAGFLRQVLQDMKRAGLVTSMSGRHGGYSLTRPAVDISVLALIEGLEGPIDDGQCALRGGPCHWVDVCAVHSVWSSSREAFRRELANASLADLAETDRAIESGQLATPPDSHRSGNGN